jgi:hypothetical protein
MAKTNESQSKKWRKQNGQKIRHTNKVHFPRSPVPGVALPGKDIAFCLALLLMGFALLYPILMGFTPVCPNG